MFSNVETTVLRKRLRKRNTRLEKQKEKIRKRENENRIIKHELRKRSQELEDIKNRMTVSFCPFCETYNLISWDLEWGLTSFCPRCGARLMLCDMCDSKDKATCDYNASLDLCKEM
jgi:hypothetical protein